MRFAKTRPMAKFKRIITVGALLAVSWTAAGAMNNAYAKDWSMVTKKETWFRCDVGCQAGGIGPVNNGGLVAPPKIGLWERTVLIRCKSPKGEGRDGYHYYVTVKDKNWAGWWWIPDVGLTRPIDETVVPAC